MHSVLRIPEILSLIIGHLEERPLARCARVCHNWFLPCIELLWKSITIPTHTRGLLVSTGLLPGDQERVFIRRQSQTGWDRVYLYTSKIRHLKYWRYPTRELPSRWADIFLRPRHSSGGTLFPRVHTFRYLGEEEEDSRFSSSLISQIPHLATLDATLASFTKQKLDGLGVAIQTVPSTLTKIVLQAPSGRSVGNEDPYDVWRQFSITLQHCSRLEVFNVDVGIGGIPMPQDIFDILGTFPHVKFIEGVFKLNFSGGRNLGLGSFPSLECLVLLRLNSGELFREQWFPPLHLRVLALQTVSEIGLCSEVLERASSRGSSLVTLCVYNLESISSSNIIGLGNHRGLRHLDLIAGGSVTLTDGDVEDLSAALPELEQFCLSFESPPCYLTLLSVYHLVRSCRKLGLITMPLDMTDIPSIPASPPSRCVRSDLELSTYQVVPQLFDTTAVANFLYYCFSQQLFPPRIGSWAGEAQWVEVDQLVQGLFISRDNDESYREIARYSAVATSGTSAEEAREKEVGK